ncbi:MAG: phosphonoacetaldehyde hydrolase [Terracidiphilus sp.]
MKFEPRLRAVMLDWAGTTVDHGSIAPVAALQALFARRGIGLTSEDARRDMGLLKRDHIQAILALPTVRNEWLALTGREPVTGDAGDLFDEFIPFQKSIVEQHSQLIEGVAEIVTEWQRRGLRIGSTTGYTREMLAPVLALAAAGGYRPDAVVCPDDVGAGRPAPWMLARNAQLLDVYPPTSCVKIGDTVSDIEEGQNAGMWTIGLTRTGNLVGLDAAGWAQLSAQEKQQRLQSAEEVLRNAGADFLAEDLPSCNPILAQIDRRLEDSWRRI